ncbi:FlaA1/EpsC-like NDP-sugar epimerase [Dysgonomonas alginatilytica]|uniref:FlaA1/EpsC-like NDP-sugar epimerase n=1 Tax=Dysgonomonas alginatilytica TaxID=1605892 RepID=A0A2V3PP14_9BACT|nr:nucleoside-diphosphate sugar epimerase/dehydratase [Dysgonomonas alginatilytica]PXV62811.1 FlaA1/EpsC-like NDP-sugar epimerase [Dysgonomonas alginatilytica]
MIHEIFNAFLKKNFLSRWVILLIDLFIILGVSILSYTIVNQVYHSLSVVLPDFNEFICISVVANLCAFLVFKTYHGIVRYSTFYEIQRIFISLLVSHVIIFLLIHFPLNFSGSITIAYCFISLLFSIIGLLGFRLFIVFAYQSFLFRKNKDKKISVYIYGTSPESVSLQQSISMYRNKYHIKGFISLDKGNTSKRIANYPILCVERDQLDDLKKEGVRAILFPNDEYFKNDKKLLDRLLSLKIKTFVVPQLKDANEPIHERIRSVQIEDLLGRPEIEVSFGIIEKNVKGKTVLVTGAAGSIGSEIVRQLGHFAPKLIVCVDQAETPLNELELELRENFKGLNFVTSIRDVRNKTNIAKVFNEFKPNVVYHAAAYKHVPMMEKDPCEAITTNVQGTKILVDLSIEYSVGMFVMISTDKAVNPTNIMGTSKRIAEIYVQSCAMNPSINKSNTKFVTTRFGNVLGSNGSVIPRFRKQIEGGGPITVTDANITRYFMTIPEACRLVLEASVIGKSGHIYVFDMGEPVKILDLATRMIELAGLVPHRDIKIAFSGLRPGEKLYEELLNDSEITQPTTHEKVMIAKVREYDIEEVAPQIEEIIHKAKNGDKNRMVILMKDLVPEFISKNSEFEHFDKQKVE